MARSLASKKVSPKGPGSGMRMLTYFINRAGHNLPATRRRELENNPAKRDAVRSSRVVLTHRAQASTTLLAYTFFREGTDLTGRKARTVQVNSRTLSFPASVVASL
jgi:hypothetical protein